MREGRLTGRVAAAVLGRTEAVKIRLEKLAADPARDLTRLREIQPWWQRYLGALEHRGYTPELDRYRWLVEEYRISLFAQELKTTEKVSTKRLEKAWCEVTRPNG